MKLRNLTILLLAVATLVAWAGYATGRNKYETAGYSTIESDGRFEIRQYQELTVAAVPMGTDTDGQRNQGFGQLFNYISGANESESKIAMTTPVFIGDAGNEKEAMSFVVPKAVASAGAPEPKGESVFLATVKGGKFASYRFSGRRSDKAEKEATKALQAWIQSRNLKSKGSPKFAYYDPPWTPGLLRRNEVLIRVN